MDWVIQGISSDRSFICRLLAEIWQRLQLTDSYSWAAVVKEQVSLLLKLLCNDILHLLTAVRRLEPEEV